MHDLPAITREILDGYALHPRGYHGVIHWARVLENGLRIADATGADREVVTLFALFHDARRVNESVDHDHGRRGGELARSLRGRLVHLDDGRFETLYDACLLHTQGHTTADPTTMTCWDADRLDLGRVGITPRPDKLCTPAGRALLDWADHRAVSGHVPEGVLAEWAIQPMTYGNGIEIRPGIERFLRAQESTFATALRELQAGRKETHWMWWIFPQLAALGRSPTAKTYGIADLEEARAYLAHPVIGPRLVEAARAMLRHQGRAPAAILGAVDALKLRSCATLFAAVPGAPPEFRAILDAFYDGEADPLTEAEL